MQEVATPDPEEIEEARKFLLAADVFFGSGRSEQELNLNDVFAWACSDGEVVADEELPELARLYKRYGDCGLLYWVVKKRGGQDSDFEHSQFADINRFIQFAKQEEKIRSEVPDSTKRAFYKISYRIGG